MNILLKLWKLQWLCHGLDTMHVIGKCYVFIMATHTADHYILQLWFLSSFFLSSFFPRLISAVAQWMSTILLHYTWCGLSANLECMSKMCCTWLAENTGCKNYAQNRLSAHHRTTLSGYIFANKACINNRKNLLNANISSTIWRTLAH